MFRTIVWATDGSANADHALVTAKWLAAESGGRLVAVHYDRRFGTGRAGAYSLRADEEDVRAKVAGQVEALTTRGIAAELVVRAGHTGSAAAAIAQVAREVAADVIVIGTRGHGSVGGALLGSVTQALLHDAPCPVLAIPPAAQ